MHPVQALMFLIPYCYQKGTDFEVTNRQDSGGSDPFDQRRSSILEHFSLFAFHY